MLDEAVLATIYYLLHSQKEHYILKQAMAIKRHLIIWMQRAHVSHVLTMNLHHISTTKKKRALAILEQNILIVFHGRLASSML